MNCPQIKNNMLYYRDKSFICVRPLFLPEKFYVVIAYKNTVELHDYQHVVIWKLGAESAVVSLEMCLHNTNKFLIAYENGNVKLCDVTLFSVVDVMVLETTIRRVFVTKNGILSVQTDGIYMYSDFDLSLKLKIMHNSFANIAFAPETGLLAMAERHEFIIRKLTDKNEKRTFMNEWKRDRHFTCIACHPTNNSVATGDTTGQVIMWWNPLNNFNQTSIYHWHFLALNSVEFNFLGTHLLTGGKENVFVKWELSINDSEKSRRFYPRLEAQIDKIRSCPSANGEYYLLTLGDNSYHIITSNLSCVNSYYNFIQRPKYLHDKVCKLTRLGPVGLISCHNIPGELRHCVMTNGHEGKLQFFSLVNNEVRYQLDVATQNWPTESENKYIPGFVQVQRAAVSHCGHYLVTYEQLGVKTNDFDHLASLRLFHFSSEEDKFTHQALLSLDSYDGIVDLIFHPSKNEHLVMVTRSSRLLLVSRTKHGENIAWTIVHTVDLGEVLHRYRVCLRHRIHHHRAVLSTVTCPHNYSDGLLAIGINSTLTIYLWSHILHFKTQPLIANPVHIMSYDIKMKKPERKKVVPDIVSLSIVNNEEKKGTYRIVCGLHSGLFVAEMIIGKDGSVAMDAVKLALGDEGGNCLVTSMQGQGSKVAVTSRKSNTLSIFDVWDDEKTEYHEVPWLEEIVWTRGTGDQWVVAGLVKEANNVHLVTCESPPKIEDEDREMRRRELECGLDLLSGLPDVKVEAEETVEVSRKRKHLRMVANDQRIKALTLYDNLDMTLALASLYQH